MDAVYTFVARRVISDKGLYQAADPIKISVLAKSISQAKKKAQTLVEDADWLLCLQDIEER